MKKIILLISFIQCLFAGDLPRYTTEDVFKQMDTYEKMYQGNSFLSKEEYKEVSNSIKEIAKENKGPFSFLLYFTSGSVPSETMLNVLFSLSILQDNGIKMQSKQYLIGFPEDFEKHITDINDLITKKYDKSKEEQMKRNFALKIDPRFFEKFELKEAPAMALATCPSSTPDIEKCKIHYLMKGDISLYTFFDTIAKEDKRYEKLTRILIANKIVDKEGK